MGKGEEVRLKVMPKEPLQVVCCAVFDPDGRLLLLQRHQDDLGGGMWATPGGRQDKGEDPAITAMREVEEETGIELDELVYLGLHELRMPHGVAHMRTYKAYVPRGIEIRINSEEHSDHQWFDVSELTASEDIIWGLPTTLVDFGLLEEIGVDPTLADGSEAVLIDKGPIQK